MSGLRCRACFRTINRRAAAGFDHAKVDAAFFAYGRIFCNLGCGDPAKIFERLPRFTSTRCAGFLSEWRVANGEHGAPPRGSCGHLSAIRYSPFAAHTRPYTGTMAPRVT